MDNGGSESSATLEKDLQGLGAQYPSSRVLNLLYLGCLEVLDTEGDHPNVDLDLLLLEFLLEEVEWLLDLSLVESLVDLLPNLSLTGVFDLLLFLSGEEYKLEKYFLCVFYDFWVNSGG